MRLYLLRHAIAVSRGTPGYAQDAQRPLTEEGHAQASDVARGLKRLKLPITLIVTSPLVRAAQTAAHVQETLGGRIAVKERGELRPESHPAETSQMLKWLVPHEHIVLVGHEPHLTAWIAELCAGVGGVRCVMKKAGIACIEIDEVPPRAGSGALRWLMTPKQLALIGRAGARVEEERE